MIPLFIGSFICRVEKKGSLALSDDFCVVVTSRESNADLFISIHESANCLVVYDKLFAREQLDGHMSPRNAEGGSSHREQDAHVRRRFGFTARTRLDGKGHIAVAPWLNERRGQAYRALVIGMGHRFEIWDLDHVMACEGADLRLLASLHLGLVDAKKDKEDFHEPVMPAVRPHHRVDLDQQQSGLRVQSLPAVLPRHDPIVSRPGF